MGRSFAIIVLLAVLLPGSADAQGRYPAVLVEPLEFLPSDRQLAGTFVRNQRDFILCRGLAYQGNPPKTGPDVRYGGRVVGKAGEWNNLLVKHLATQGKANRGLFLNAYLRYRAGLKSDPQFFPFLYNAGRVLLLMNRPAKAARMFARARGVMPAFWGTYMNLGQAHAVLGNEHAAAANFREAARRNPFVYKPYIALGNLYLNLGSSVKADYYFRRVLAIEPNYSNAKIGLARLMMKRRDLIRARVLLLQIRTRDLDGTRRRDYDRSLHFYLAIIAADLRDYAEAVRQYDLLLSFPNDPFFLTNSSADIIRRRNIVRKLADVRALK